MKTLLLSILFMVTFASAQLKNMTWSRLDTSMAFIDTIAGGIQIRDNANDSLVSLSAGRIQLDTLSSAPAWRKGQLWYDTLTQTSIMDASIPNVRLTIGEEMYYSAYNQTGDSLYNGTVVYASGSDTLLETVTVSKADNRYVGMNLHTLGLLTHDCANNQMCKVTFFGLVHDINTTALDTTGDVWLDTAGLYTSVPPLHPNDRVFLGTATKKGVLGTIQVKIQRIGRPEASSTEAFNSSGLGAGVFYMGGAYSSPATSSNLAVCNDSVSYGSANNPYHAHAFIVGGPTASVTGGTVGLYATGSAYNEYTRTVSVINDTLTTDITTYTLNEYDETPTKYVGAVKFKLFTTAGTPSACSYRFNYGYSKYEDYANRDFTISTIDCNFRAGANDPDFKIEVLHHKPTGWTYNATAFVAGDGIIASSTEMAPYDDLVNGVRWIWEVNDIHVFINGADAEGVVTRVTTGLNNSVTTGRCHYANDIETIQ